MGEDNSDGGWRAHDPLGPGLYVLEAGAIAAKAKVAQPSEPRRPYPDLDAGDPFDTRMTSPRAGSSGFLSSPIRGPCRLHGYRQIIRGSLRQAHFEDETRSAW